MKKPFQLIGLTGTAGCGKDTVAEFLRDVYAFRTVSLADPIRRGVCEMFGLSHEYMTDRVLKEQPIHHLCNKSPRQLMQTLGTEWGRNYICTHIWLNIAQRKIDMDRKLYERNNSFPEGIVVSDIRFDGEAKWLKDQGGEIWFINRPDNPYALTDNDHESEAGVSLEYIDKTIINDSDVDELFERIALLMECHTEINQPETEAS